MIINERKLTGINTVRDNAQAVMFTGFICRGDRTVNNHRFSRAERRVPFHRAGRATTRF